MRAIYVYNVFPMLKSLAVNPVTTNQRTNLSGSVNQHDCYKDICLITTKWAFD